MSDAIAAMRTAFGALATGDVIMPARANLPVKEEEAVTLVMPAYVATSDNKALAVKVVSVFPHNPKRNLPRINAAVMVFEPDTGRPLALLEGGELTAIRTAAGSGLATDLLARPDATSLTIFGAGVQARSHFDAICEVRPIESVTFFSPDPTKTDAMIAELLASNPGAPNITAADSPGAAVAGADIVCCTTTSQTPVFDDTQLAEGVHINAVGSYTPDVSEVPAETVARAKVFVDERAASLEEAGEIIQTINKGLITDAHIVAELGELVTGASEGRSRPTETTFYKSVGIAVQDAVAAAVALKRAHELGLGEKVDW